MIYIKTLLETTSQTNSMTKRQSNNNIFPWCRSRSRNYPTNFCNNNNHAMTLQPQVHIVLSTLPQYSYLPILSNYQNYESDHFNNYVVANVIHQVNSIINDLFHH